MNKFLNILFAGIILFILGFFAWHIEKADTVGAENRSAAPMPAVRVQGGGNLNRRFAAEFEDFLTDHFIYRTDVIHLWSDVKNWLDHRGNNRVIIGKDGWLFNNRVANYDNLDNFAYFQRKIKWNAGDFKVLKDHLTALKSWADRHNVAVYMMIPPDKTTIYGEFMPDYIKQGKGPSLARQVEKTAAEIIPIVPLEDIFLQHKHDVYLHYKTESHWSEDGAFLAYREMMNRIHQDNPDIKPLSVTDFNRVKTPLITSSLWHNGSHGYRLKYEGNLASFLHVKAPSDPLYYHYDYRKADHIHTVMDIPWELSENKEGLPYTVVMIGDSYNDYVFPFMAATFKNVHKYRINARRPWGIRFNANEKRILSVRPDILILSVSDLKLHELLRMF